MVARRTRSVLADREVSSYIGTSRTMTGKEDCQMNEYLTPRRKPEFDSRSR